ncbi:ceramidase domain-containing protein [Roseivirga sp. UBA838]|uniref:ceramidase domain-containing protein n=1 Tax=Roseivirga sp. UBA838 TaxID=1947393 RepID=UPI00257C0005|nr:ceramidase domain-containing protein [Roseivirga sp. UBA838]|tara:strand:- start:32071 stop:32772 length:702 start_codon:yes stop_codon:yes gene_type:complete
MYLGPEQITDGGPWYAETHITDSLIVEPWNAFSSLAIAAPAIYYLWKIRKNPLQYGFLLACIPLLFLNGLGSTLFHGLRSSRIFLLMDFMPALALTLVISIYFWIKALPKWWMGIIAVTPVFLMRLGVIDLVPGQRGINTSYMISGIAFLLPVFLILRKYHFKKTAQIIISAICFVLAIYFRQVDKLFTDIIPFGTHFLWHIFSGIGAFLLADYLYFMRTQELKVANKLPEGS